MRVFLDANILFSAAKTDGAVRRLLNLLHEGGHEVWIDPYVLAEARRNLLAKGPDAMEVLDRLLDRLRLAPALGALSPTGETLDWLPEKDRPVLAAAIRLRCDVLVTGDRTHFGAGYGLSVSGVTVLSPAMVAERLLDDATP